MDNRDYTGARNADIGLPAGGRPVHLHTQDGASIGGYLWQAERPDPKRPVVVISPATCVKCSYYTRFADYLFCNGLDVLTFDYRGIGLSKPTSLRGFQADWVAWGEKDLEAALIYAQTVCPQQPIHGVGHSIGGFALGLAPSSSKLQRILTVGAQFAYWRDYAEAQRARMYLKWHVAMPVLTSFMGYFPAKRLGWMEDAPAGVVRDWSRMKARFEDTVRQDLFIGGERESDLLRRRFTRISAPILAIGLDDDPHGTVRALERLLAYFSASKRQHLRIAPSDIGAQSIGHFAFFHERFSRSLWPLALDWLRDGVIADKAPGRLLSATKPEALP